MSSVLVGMFDTRAEAEQARTKLMDAGLNPGQVTWNAESGGDSTTATTGLSPATTAPVEKEGMFSHFFHSIFGSDDTTSEHSSTYQEAFKRGGFGLTVSASDEDEIERASDIMDDCGAFDVDERSQQWKSEGWAGASSTTGSTLGATGSSLGTSASTLGTTASTLDTTSSTALDSDVAVGGTQKLNIVEESLAVGKRTVGRGGVRVFSRVVEVPVQETVRLREERADVQRSVVDRPATEADFAAFKEGSIEVRSSAEEAVVGKTARVVGEVEVGKTVTERDEVVRDTVRKTEVDVEQIAGTETATSTTGTTTGATTSTTPIAPLSGTGTTGTGI